MEIVMWMLFGGFILTCMLYLALTEDNDQQQH